MAIHKVSFRGREDKAIELVRVFRPFLNGEVLDVGCDAKHLSKLIDSKYVGADISDKADIRINCEYNLPFRDRSFDTVLAMDILEHCDRLHQLFKELSRIARKYVIIGLPNIYEWHFRLLFLLGQGLGGKYGLPINPQVDRHRWIFTLNEARMFVEKNAVKLGFQICEEALGYYIYNKTVPRIITYAGKQSGEIAAPIFAYHYWSVIKRE